MPRHSVEMGLERVHNWEQHSAVRGCANLRPRRADRKTVTDPEPWPDRRPDRIRVVMLRPEERFESQNKRTAKMIFLAVLAITFAVSAVISLFTLERWLSARGRADADKLALAAERRHAQRYHGAVAALQAELRALRAHHEAARLADRRRRPVDHASALLGGRVEATPLTRGFPTRDPGQLLLPADELGQCWGFEGERGAAVVRLAASVAVTHVALVHLGRSAAAPRDFRLAGVDGDRLHPLGSFTYDLSGPERQEFRVRAERAFDRVRLDVDANHGFPSTCVYRLQVYGFGDAGVPIAQPSLG